MIRRIALGLALVALAAAAQGAERPPPRLVLQITVDQLRGDMPMRFREHLGSGGFRYLMRKGIHYRNAHYLHASTETIVGHTSLATGAYPSDHGMIGNVWFDRKSGALTYNIEDSRYRLLGEGGVDKKTEIDPTQRAARSSGRSPAAILASTFSDQLAIHFNKRSKIFAVSVKDRGAVPMAGHAGKAFWFSKANGRFVTSSYYYKRYPAWVTAWNKQRKAFRYAGKAWTLLNERSTYLFGKKDPRRPKLSLPVFGTDFPHPYGKADSKLYTTALTLSPAGDALTLDFAKALIVNEKLGQDDIPDYLSISFSSTDYVGHFFGPSSLEMEDNVRRLDRVLAELFAFIDKTVGLNRTLIVLSSDHGGPETPGYLKSMGIPAGYIDVKGFDKTAAMAALKKKFGVEGKTLIRTYFHPYVYLDRRTIRAKGLNQEAVERAVAAELGKAEGVALALSSSAVAAGTVPDTWLTRAVRRNFHPRRSGDVYVVWAPGWFINEFSGVRVAATHGSPWRYDTYVPVFFAGYGLKASVVHRRVTPYDVAPTLAARLGLAPPSASSGNVLREVLQPSR